MQEQGNANEEGNHTIYLQENHMNFHLVETLFHITLNIYQKRLLSNNKKLTYPIDKYGK